MDKITFEDFLCIMSYDIKQNICIEIEFCIDNDDAYQGCWMGKLPDKETKQSVYWFGLVKDGSQAYDFESFELLADAKVFGGRSIKEIWDSVSE